MKNFIWFIRLSLLKLLFGINFELISDTNYFLRKLLDYEQKDIERINILLQSSISDEQKRKLEFEKYVILLHKAKINKLINKWTKILEP